MAETKTDIESAKSLAFAHRKATANADVSYEQSQQAYNVWAGLYEQTLSSLGRTAHVRTAECAANSFPRESRDGVRILDVGAGTGMVGKELKQLEFSHVDALEPNEVMLDKARKRGIYENYYVEYLTEEPSSIPEDSYDAVTGCGIFAESAHVPFGALDEMIRVVKSGGYIILSARSAFVGGTEEGKKLETVMEKLEKNKKWKKVTEDRLSDYTKNIKESGIIWKFQVM
ncbi:uncharacterized protein LOC123561412 [Mercenaria mercenaria]|uniref:uncharacterized protein LOC123561412 n=1 Tax=Mercenaria mercenaria TaxID=6596 RepID=UPI00234ED3A7|nr:uncharacterized protein LOC123561412 [Mercenaria mercenaria]XP_045209698.2 uncharacterized protein LOC123561412 [Mercenaria mercenaria]